MIKYILITLISSLVFLSADVVTTSSTRTIEGTGLGLSRKEAINNALVEAIGQLNGVSIEKQIIVDDSSVESSSGDKSSYKYNSKISKITRGKVDSYSIVSVEEIFDGKYEAVVEVKKTTRTTKFKSPGISHKNRRKIAVMPFYTASSNYKVGDKRYSAAKMSLMVSQALTTDITQSRRFAVVDRTYAYNMASELNLINSKHVPVSQKVKLGQILGADYLLVGTIQSASMSNKTNVNQSTGQADSKNMAEFIVDYRVIVVGTSQIKWSDTAVIEVELKSGSSEDIMLQRAINNLSNDITKKLLGNIYPMRVVKVTSIGEVILNQGGSLLHRGDIYNVFKIGDKIYDPYTKESLGREETKVAQIEISKVNPKNSYAKVLDSKVSMVKKGYICRPQSDAKHSSVVVDNKDWRKASVEVQDGGGVKLPFD
jgi:curli biogenesis system outer membrane secretion channel CsgG